MKLTRDEVEDLDLPYSCIWEQHTHDSRWANHFEGVFEHPDRGFYMISWQRGKSEGQEDMDTWYDESEIEALPAESYQVIETKWQVSE